MERVIIYLIMENTMEDSFKEKKSKMDFNWPAVNSEQLLKLSQRKSA